MCGILIHFPDYNRDIKERIKILGHRGLYTKTEIINGWGFGHARLPISGLDTAFDCPYHVKKNKMIYLYNGEVYNYKELRPGAPYKADIDVWNSEDQSGFDGDFVCAAYDELKDELNISTDLFGKKQLYMRVDDKENKVVAIASEVKALLEPDDIIDMAYMSTVAKFGYNFGNNRTICTSIVKMSNNYVYNFSRDGRMNIAMPKNFNSKFQLPEELRLDSPKNKSANLSHYFVDLMEHTIKRRIVSSDVPIAVLFSGGLDSSILLYHIGNLVKTGIINNIEIFTIDNSDDLLFAKRYAEELNIKLNYISLNKTNFQEDYNKIHIMNESAVDLGSVIPKFYIFEKIREAGFTVALGASGADEVFGGYKRMKDFDFQYNDIFNELVYYHLPRLDRVSMANTVEYRTPFTADYIIDFGMTLAYEDRIDKKFLRETYRGLIPDYIVDRPKVPLKSNDIRENKIGERIYLVNRFVKDLFPLMLEMYGTDYIN